MLQHKRQSVHYSKQPKPGAVNHYRQLEALT
jgi:hypothetical protein